MCMSLLTSLGNVLGTCRGVSTSMRTTLAQLQVVALHRTTEKQVRLVESGLASSFCIGLARSLDVFIQINTNSFVSVSWHSCIGVSS